MQPIQPSPVDMGQFESEWQQAPALTPDNQATAWAKLVGNRDVLVKLIRSDIPDFQLAKFINNHKDVAIFKEDRKLQKVLFERMGEEISIENFPQKVHLLRESSRPIFGNMLMDTIMQTLNSDNPQKILHRVKDFISDTRFSDQFLYTFFKAHDFRLHSILEKPEVKNLFQASRGESLEDFFQQMEASDKVQIDLSQYKGKWNSLGTGAQLSVIQNVAATGSFATFRELALLLARENPDFAFNKYSMLNSSVAEASLNRSGVINFDSFVRKFVDNV